MKNIHKIFVIIVVVSVVISLVCVTSSAFTYEGRSGEYYIPECIYSENPVGEDFKFILDCIAPVKQEAWLSYFTAGSHVSMDSFSGDDMLLYNTSILPTSDAWLSYVIGLDLKVDQPIKICFTYLASIDTENAENVCFELIFQDPNDYGTSNYFTDDTSLLFTVDDLLKSGRDFISDLSYSDSENFVTVVADVEVLIDPISSKAFFTLTDENGDVLCLSDYVNLNCFLGFKVSALRGWEYIGFESDSNKHHGYEGFSAYYLERITNNQLSSNPHKSIILDGSSYEGMTPNVTNYSNGFSTDYNGYPVMENGYYKLTTNSSSSSQAQLWFPSQEYGISGFSSEKHSYGELSFDISAAVRDYVEFKFVEGIDGERWGSDWCIEESFIKIVPVDISFDTGIAVFDVLGCGGVVLTQHTVDVYNEPYANWFNVEVKITLDPIADAILLDYYINDEYVASCSTPLTTANNSITSIYCSLRTNIPESGILLDNFEFYYVNDDDYRFEYSAYVSEYLDKLSCNEYLSYYYDYKITEDQNTSLSQDMAQLKSENEDLKALNIKLGADLQGAIGTDALDKVFSGTWQGISGMVNDIFGLGINLDGNTANGNEITIGLLAVIVIVCFVIVKILPLLIGVFKV